MANVGGQPGNKNATKNKIWAEALDRAIAQDDGKRLRGAAEKLLDLAADGEQWAVKELGDRLDGKPTQQTEISGPDGGAIESSLTVQFVDAGGVPEQA